jgi:hypothetical protein
MAIYGAAAGSIVAAYAYRRRHRPDQRAARFGLFSAALSAGGAGLQSVADGRHRPAVAVLIAAGLAFANLTMASSSFGILPIEQRAALKWRSIHPIGAVASIWRDYPILKDWRGAMSLMSFASLASTASSCCTSLFGRLDAEDHRLHDLRWLRTWPSGGLVSKSSSCSASAARW